MLRRRDITEASFARCMTGLCLTGVLPLLSAGILLTSCGQDTVGPKDNDPDPIPNNTPTQLTTDLPTSYAINYPEAHYIKVFDADTIKQATITYQENDNTIWQKTLNNTQQTHWDTTWTPNPQEPGNARISYELTDKHPTNQQTKSDARNITLQPSTWQQATIDVENFFDQTPLQNGYLTFSGHRTIPITNGQATIHPEDKIDADSLQQGQLRILLEAEGHLVYSNKAHPDKPLRAIPREHNEADENNWSWEKHKPYLSFQYPGKTRRWAHDAEIDAYHYDESILEGCEGEGGCFNKTDNKNLLASDFFIQTSLEVHKELETLLQNAGSNITINTHLESESDYEFPQRTREKNAIQLSGQPTAPFGISHSTRDDKGVIYNALMVQQTDAKNGPTNMGRGSIRSDGIETFGVNTSQGGLPGIITEGLYKQPITRRMLEIVHQHPAQTGTHEDMNLDNKDGGRTHTIEFYVP